MPYTDKEITFESTDERDVWLTENYPERKCTNIPGVYKISWGYLSVFLETVTLSTYRRAK